jgi:DNA-binding beta-propeller fold protein YncE
MLELRRHIAIPPHTANEFDHGDVHVTSGRIFVAHTAADTLEILDGVNLTTLATIPGCPEGSGVLCAQDDDLVFAAARGAGKVLVIQTSSGVVRRELSVGPRPNGLAWDPGRQRLLVADVQENTARLLDPSRESAWATLATIALPGRPRWTVYDSRAERFLINILEPASVAVVDAQTATLVAQWPVSASGPHGLDLDLVRRRAFVACDGGAVVALDLATGQELGWIAIAGGPDAIWYNPNRQLLYVAVGAPGVVEVVDTRELRAMRVVQHVETEPEAHTTAFDVARQRLYVFLPGSCRAAVYVEV